MEKVHDADFDRFDVSFL